MSQKCRLITFAGLGVTAFVLSTSNVIAQQKTPHLEGCTRWEEQNGQMGFTNNCGKPVVAMFRSFSPQRNIEGTVEPGERFGTGLLPQQFKDWMSTRCAVGYRPSVAFVPANKKAIIDSKYECIKK